MMLEGYLIQTSGGTPCEESVPGSSHKEDKVLVTCVQIAMKWRAGTQDGSLTCLFNVLRPSESDP